MLFYIKKYIWLELAVTLLLGSAGYIGIRSFDLPFDISFNLLTVVYGFAAFVAITGWTFLVQKGYAFLRGKEFAKQLTISLAKEYAEASPLQAIFGGITAAFGEELFFRGFIQGKWGIAAGTILFGLAHFGKKDIRVVSYWSFAHGLLFGLSYSLAGNLLVPMIAHGLFDLGGVVYFRIFMKNAPQPT